MGKCSKEGESRYKGPEVGAFLVCLRHKQGFLCDWRVLGDEAREINMG